MIIIFRKVRKLHCSHVIVNINKTTTHDDGLLATKPIFYHPIFRPWAIIREPSLLLLL